LVGGGAEFVCAAKFADDFVRGRPADRINRINRINRIYWMNSFGSGSGLCPCSSD